MLSPDRNQIQKLSFRLTITETFGGFLRHFLAFFLVGLVLFYPFSKMAELVRLKVLSATPRGSVDLLSWYNFLIQLIHSVGEGILLLLMLSWLLKDHMTKHSSLSARIFQKCIAWAQLVLVLFLLKAAVYFMPTILSNLYGDLFFGIKYFHMAIILLIIVSFWALALTILPSLVLGASSLGAILRRSVLVAFRNGLKFIVFLLLLYLLSFTGDFVQHYYRFELASGVEILGGFLIDHLDVILISHVIFLIFMSCLMSAIYRQITGDSAVSQQEIEAFD